MRRREFLGALGGAAAIAWPPATRAQQQYKLPIIGFLGASSPSLASQRIAAFEQRLRELGWIEGRTVAIDYQWERGHFGRATEIFADFVAHKVDVIVTHATANVVAAKKVTSTIPIVFAVAADPVGTGLVASLARPGGNVTGFSLQATDLASKRLGLLREILPSLGRLGILLNVANPASVLERQEVQAASAKLKIATSTVEIRETDDFSAAFDAFKGNVDALYVCADPLVNTHRLRINTLALSARLPTMEDNREFVAAGGLVSYGPNVPDMFRRAAEFVDKILRGVKPAEIPVEQPTKFDLILNLITAKALGLTVPLSLLARADEVIE